VSEATAQLRYPRPVQARATVRGVMALQLVANGAGAAVVVFYLRVVAPVRLESGESRIGLNLTAFGLYLVAAVFFALPLNAVILRRSMAWVRDGRVPSTLERIDTVTQPLRQTLSAFLMWVGGAIIFAYLNEETARTGIGIAISGVITCSLLYQLLERHFRPVTALALDGADLPRWRREIRIRIMLGWLLGSAVPLVGIGLAPLATPDANVADAATLLAILAFTSIVAGGLVMSGAANSVAAPIEEVREALARMEAGDLDVHLPITNIGEIGHLQQGVNTLAHGLRERRRLQDLFGRQVGVDVARAAIERDPQLGGEERTVTVLFVDLCGFTTYAESHAPTEVVAYLNRFFQVVLREVGREGGWVNKFEGDAALCIFGAPDNQLDHSSRALRAAASLRAAVVELPGAPRIGLGVATGTVVAGNVGGMERFEYTVIGDAVNVAARLTEMAKGDEGAVLATDTAIDASPTEAHRWERMETVVLRGRATPTVLYRPVADQSSVLTSGLPSGPQS
jgi:adenylate cyclase